jgi:hypothetical protein
MNYANKLALSFTLIVILTSSVAYAQLPETLSDRYIRVAEMGELVDSINVWGDVNSAGRYLVPEGTILPDLISFSFGYTQLRDRDASIDWAKLQIEVKVSRYIENRRVVEVAYFRYRYHDPEPIEMWEFDLNNNDIVTIQVRRRPSLTDYVGVVAPIITLFATSFLLVERLRGN